MNSTDNSATRKNGIGGRDCPLNVHDKATMRPSDTDRQGGVDDEGFLPGRLHSDMPEWVSRPQTLRGRLRGELFGARMDCAVAHKTWVESGRTDSVALEECKAKLRQISRLQRVLREFS